MISRWLRYWRFHDKLGSKFENVYVNNKQLSSRFVETSVSSFLIQITDIFTFHFEISPLFLPAGIRVAVHAPSCSLVLYPYCSVDCRRTFLLVPPQDSPRNRMLKIVVCCTAVLRLQLQRQHSFSAGSRRGLQRQEWGRCMTVDVEDGQWCPKH
jgi:hypothetical protein